MRESSNDQLESGCDICLNGLGPQTHELDPHFFENPLALPVAANLGRS